MLILEVLILPVFSVFFRISILNPLPNLIPVIIFSTIGFAAVGTLLSAISVDTCAREVMLPVLFFPVILPVVIAAVKSTTSILAGMPFSDISSWPLFVIGFDLIFFIISLLLLDIVPEE